MNLAEAYVYMDMLLDKADEPYFTNEEKLRFLNLSISEFINMNYEKMDVDEDARRAITGCIRWVGYTLTAADIVSDGFIYNGAYPALSEKYQDDGVYDNTGTVIANTTHTPGFEDLGRGFFKWGNQYVLPERHLYTVSVGIRTYNKDDVIDPSNGTFTGSASSDVKVNKERPVKPQSVRDYWNIRGSEDPFNKHDHPSTEIYPKWSYIGNRMVFGNIASRISQINIEYVYLPTPEQAFSEDTFGGNAPAPRTYTFAEHFQKQIIQMAVRKMSGNVESGNYQIKQIESEL